MEKIYKYSILLPYIHLILSDVILFSYSGAFALGYLFLFTLIVVGNFDMLLYSRGPLLKFTIAYVFIILIYEFLSPALSANYNPYNKNAYYQFAITGLAFWIMGRKKINLYTDSNIRLIMFLTFIYVVYLGVQVWMFRGFYHLDLYGEEDALAYLLSFPYNVMWLGLAAFLFPKYVRIGVLAVILFLIVLTTKRGPLVAIVLGLIVVLISNRKISLKDKLLLAIGGGIIYFVIDSYFWVYFDDAISRFTGRDTIEELSTGRADIYSSVFNGWLEGGVAEKIFGFGFEQTHVRIMHSSYGRAVGSHNDYLEMLYNMGLLGFFVFIGFVISCLIYVWKAIRMKFKYKNLMVLGFMCFAVSCMFSSNINRWSTNIFCMLFFYSAGLLDNEMIYNKKLTNKIKL